MPRRLVFVIVSLLGIAACSSTAIWSAEQAAMPSSKFEPLDGRILVLAGQSVRATLDYYGSDVVPRPAGFTDYISYDVGSPYRTFAPDYPKKYQGNDALLEATNWGSGSQCVDCNLHRPEFKQAVVAIGMYIAGPRYADGSLCTASEACNTYKIASGQYDHQLQVLADWMNSLNGRPVFLRIGYEFDGSWNNYQPEQYKAAYKYIFHFLKKSGVNNVAFIWQSFGYASMKTLESFYPQADDYSDQYVDWVGYTHFNIEGDKPGINELKFARGKGLKAFISEVTPHTGDCTQQIDIARDTELAKQWVGNFIQHVEKNRDVIRGLSYINEQWNDKQYAPQWEDQQDHNCGGYFSKSNARLQDNKALEKLWAEKISGPIFLNWQSDLYQQLQQ